MGVKEKMKILDVGCGRNKYRSKNPKDIVIGVDVKGLPGVDIVHDLNKFPWPFKNNEFDLVICNHVLEHLNDIVKVLNELHRICKKGAIIKIRAPHFASACAWSDLTHKHPFGYLSLDYMAINPHKRGVGEKLAYEYSEGKKFYVKPKIILGKLHRILGIQFLANKFPIVYEFFFCYIFPPREIHFDLKVIK